MSAHREAGWVALLSEILRGTPKLDGACVGRWPGLWDPPEQGQQLDHPDVQHRHTAALEICGSCVCRDQCRDWVDSLAPSMRPAGVVAGRLPTATQAAA